MFLEIIKITLSKKKTFNYYFKYKIKSITKLFFPVVDLSIIGYVSARNFLNKD